MHAPILRLDPSLETALASGHPWIYRNHLPPHRLETGDWVRLVAGRAEAVGVYDAAGQVAVRLFARERVPAAADLAARVEEARALRRRWVPPETDAYRLLFGEGDFLPGLVADRYGRFLVVKAYSEGVRRAVLPAVVKALGRALRPRGIVLRNAEGLEPLYGEPPPPKLTVRERGLRFVADLHRGQKTGLFLDQRENRQKVRELAAGARVLNLFAYNGGFSVYALAGGAAFARSVDVSEGALADARENARLNGLAERHEAVRADVFEFLNAHEETYDLVVLDPPALAKKRAQLRSALRAYVRLGAGAMRRVRPGGLLAAASCTAQVSPTAFREALAEAARRAGVRTQIVHEAGHAPDHPLRPEFPEGRYLKFAVLRVLEPIG
ncbi:rRNA (guanine-N(2)-)-methyltransferase [Oceanithermus profundus DSM 14977]|uniref:rRNA (Guanine-N(2)-)-methyltransferase n=1 Tax=Oceanithermus profundus (strain DSM 14977 / NBRC 100410 / VKM B-2274 / 506) TaxID=670487 RepID=E4U6G9_OCEP5|nr:class I SAM-dependent rRNA methyltransferase [Oceanithermus profundus]ADR35655.1 rRNA (guanine-N(2)-)-methyltransferase [Oceanithermus profundus DSM 14977]